MVWRMLHEPAFKPGDHPTKITIEATPTAVRAALADARAVWCNAGIAISICDTAEQVLAEVLNNVVEHAQADRPDGLIELAISRSGDSMICDVRDDGAPMPGLCLPAGDMAEIDGDLQSLPEGGFGWYMIRTLTEDLNYERRDGCNHLHFRILAG